METVQMMATDLDIRPVARLSPDASLGAAAAVLAEMDHGTLVVDTDPLSEVTERDLVVALAEGATRETLLSAVARRAPLFVHRDATADEVAQRMITSGRRALVVVDGGRPLGVIEFRCVVAALWGATSWLGAFRVALHVEGSG